MVPGSRHRRRAPCHAPGEGQIARPTGTAGRTVAIEPAIGPPRVGEPQRKTRRPAVTAAQRPIRAHLPALTIGLLWFGLACRISLAEHATYNSTSRDLGVYLQVLWNTGHGQPYQTTLLETNRIHVAEHVAPLLALLAPLYAAFPDPRWLFVLQHAALALSGIPVYLLARRLLGSGWLPTLVMAAFYATPTLVEIAFDAFYPISFAALPLGFAAYFLLVGRRRPGTACALLALAIEEEAALGVLGLGAFLLLRRATRRGALPLLAIGGLWLGLLAFAVMPAFHEPSTAPATADNRTVGHFDRLRQEPAHVVAALVTERAPLAARWLLAPTGGLALLAPEILLIDLPHAATLLLADKEGRFRRHWAAPMLPAIWLAAVVGLARLRRPPLRMAGVAVLVVGSLGSYLADSSLPGGGDHEPADIVWTSRAEQLRYLVAAVPPDASVAASRRALGHLADRSELYVFPPGYGGRLWPPERRVQAYVLDLTNDGTREALVGRQSPLRAARPYAIWLAGPEAMLLTERPMQPTQPIGRDLGDIRLLGYDVRRDRGIVDFTLHWQAQQRLGRPLARVARLLDDAGGPVAEQRGTALDALFPTNEWARGQLVLDRLRLAAPDGWRGRVEVGWSHERGAYDGVELRLDGGGQ